tara:strand:- start:3807 stop:4037 length:231 start_codon:yes stop_codon:yes gene_type:complete
MSENNDILEYIVQCLLTNRVNGKKPLKVRRDTRNLIDGRSNDLLNHNIQFIVNNKLINNLESSYQEYSIEESSFKF